MIEFNSEEEIAVFDGRVINRFRPHGTSEHYHINFVRSVEIVTDRKDRKYLQFNLKAIYNGKTNLTNPRLSPEDIPQAQAFIDEVMKAVTPSEE